ncbi:lysine--tRNA ligase, partial [Patescibacteria group bacterium]|nr:lysine--tRNA ligase [Patescibacteria group bacterium]
MKSLDKIKKHRLDKLENLKKAGINPYPAESLRSFNNKQALDEFNKNKKISLVGRIRSIRGHGGSCFCHIEDEFSQIQVYLRENIVGKKEYNLFIENIDIGDFIQVSGKMFLTKKGEKTLEVGSWKILTKSLLPLPEEWYGLKDV